MTTEIDKLAWLHIKDKRILCARSKGKATFYLPGGNREPGESDEQALIREIREELSVELIADTLELVGAFHAQADGKAEGTVVKVTCYRADYGGEIAAAAEIEEVKWLGYRDRNSCSPAGKIILEWSRKQGLID